MKKLLLASTLLVGLCPLDAHAISKKITSPSVHKGEVEVENFGNVAFNDDGGEDTTDWTHKSEVEYGFTDRIKGAIGIEFEKEDSEDVITEAIELEGTYLLTPEGSFVVDAALQAAYVINTTGDADAIEGKLLLGKSFEPYEVLANLSIEREVGDDSADGVELGAALGAYREFTGFELGGEYYADFGNTEDDNDYDDQEHQIGPVIGFDLPISEAVEGEMKLGYLVGISEAAADHAIKYELEFEF